MMTLVIMVGVTAELVALVMFFRAVRRLCQTVARIAGCELVILEVGTTEPEEES